jgi:hypothetical protein
VKKQHQRTLRLSGIRPFVLYALRHTFLTRLGAAGCDAWTLARIGNCRRDLLDHVIVVNERHLKRLMNEYVRYYHEDRTHLGLEKQTPVGREAATDSDADSLVIAMPRLGGLHHRYDLAA